MILLSDYAHSHFLSQVSQFITKLFPSYSQVSIASRDNSTISRVNSTISRVNSTISRPKWFSNILKIHSEHGIMNSVQNDKRTSLTWRHCSDQRCYPMRTRLMCEVLIDDQGVIDLFFTPNEMNVPTLCILDLDSYNQIFPRFRLSDLFDSYFSGEIWQSCAQFIIDRNLVSVFYDEAIVTSDTVAVFELDLYQMTSKYFIPYNCDNKYKFLSRLKHILSI